MLVKSLGAGQVWAAHFGGKVPMHIWQATFATTLPKEMNPPTAFDVGMTSPDPLRLCTFGLQHGRAVLDIFGFQVHPLFPGVVCEEEMTVQGTLELKQQG